MARNKDYDDELLDELYEESKVTDKEPSEHDLETRYEKGKLETELLDEAQEKKPRFSEADYKFDDDFDDDIQEDDDDVELPSEKGIFTKYRMIRAASVFAGVFLITVICIAFFVHGKTFSKTLDNANDKPTPTIIVIDPNELPADATSTPTPTVGSVKGEIQAGCLNVTIVPGYTRPDSGMGTGGGNTANKPAETAKDPTKAPDAPTTAPVVPTEAPVEPTVEVINTPAPVEPEVTEEPTPEITEEVTPEITEEATPEITEEVTQEVVPEVTEEVKPEVTEDPAPVEQPNDIQTPEIEAETPEA